MRPLLLCVALTLAGCPIERDLNPGQFACGAGGLCDVDSPDEGPIGIVDVPIPDIPGAPDLGTPEDTSEEDSTTSGGEDTTATGEDATATGEDATATGEEDVLTPLDVPDVDADDVMEPDDVALDAQDVAMDVGDGDGTDGGATDGGDIPDVPEPEDIPDATGDTTTGEDTTTGMDTTVDGDVAELPDEGGDVGPPLGDCDKSLCASAVRAGGLHTCVIRDSDSAVACFGRNDRGQCGVADKAFVSTPALVTLPGPAVALDAGGDHSCAIVSGGAVWCWGSNSFGQATGTPSLGDAAPAPVALGSPAIALALGDRHSCAIVSGGGVACWGANDHFQLGSTDKSLSAGSVPELTGITQLGAGFDHTCAVGPGNLTRCWGFNSATQLGNNQTEASALPVEVIHFQDITAVAGGQSHTLALRAGGAVGCWGLFVAGAATKSMVTADLLPGHVVTQMDVSFGHHCATTTLSKAVCWGKNDKGQLGQGTTSDPVPPAVLVPGVTSVEEVAVGDEHTCVRRTGGLVYCFGSRDDGQLGDGVVDTAAGNPVPSLVLPATE